MIVITCPVCGGELAIQRVQYVNGIPYIAWSCPCEYCKKIPIAILTQTTGTDYKGPINYTDRTTIVEQESK